MPGLEDLEPKIALSGADPLPNVDPPVSETPPRRVYSHAVIREPGDDRPIRFLKPLPPNLQLNIPPVDEEERFTYGPIINLVPPAGSGPPVAVYSPSIHTPEMLKARNFYLGVFRYGLIVPNVETLDLIQPLSNAVNGPMLEWVVLRDPEDYAFWFDLDEVFPHEPISQVVQTPDGPQEVLFPWVTDEQIIYYLVVPSLPVIPF